MQPDRIKAVSGGPVQSGRSGDAAILLVYRPQDQTGARQVSDKASARKTLLLARNALSEQDQRTFSGQVCASVLSIISRIHPAGVFVYIALPDEVRTQSLIDELAAERIVVTVPRLVDREEMRAVEFPGWTEMRPGPLGIPAPISDVACADSIDVAVVPGLGFTPDGGRLGFGAGYYDRWFSKHPAIFKIGVAFDCQITDSLPEEPHDVGMDCIVTERRAIRVTAR